MLRKGAGGIAGAVAAWRSDRTDERKADLAAMRVAGEHQVEIGRHRPPELVWGVGKQDADWLASSIAGRQGTDIGGWRKPRQFVAGKDERSTSEIDLLPRTAEVLEARACE